MKQFFDLLINIAVCRKAVILSTKNIREQEKKIDKSWLQERVTFGTPIAEEQLFN